MNWKNILPRRPERGVTTPQAKRDPDHVKELLEAEEKLSRQDIALQILAAEVELRTRQHGNAR